MIYSIGFGRKLLLHPPFGQVAEVSVSRALVVDEHIMLRNPSTGQDFLTPCSERGDSVNNDHDEYYKLQP